MKSSATGANLVYWSERQVLPAQLPKNGSHSRHFLGLMFPALIHTSTHLKGGILGVPRLHRRESQFSIITSWKFSFQPAYVDLYSLSRCRKILSQDKGFRYRKMASQNMEKLESDVDIIDYSQDVPLSTSYEVAMEALSSLIRQKKRGDRKGIGGKYGKLDRMRMYIKILDLEEHMSGLKIIHVAGTKGKGSTCTFCEAILRESGFRTGLFTSPHLIDVRERFQINGVDISEDKFLLYFWNCWNRLKEHETEDLPMPPLFQFLTVLAFKIFVCEQVDVSIIEVGLGGRKDSTNVVIIFPWNHLIIIIIREYLKNIRTLMAKENTIFLSSCLFGGF
ncbi:FOLYLPOLYGLUTAMATE SYNTHASE [Salix purpurea]|uniref:FOLYLPOLYGLUTAMATE SYNTHASE n=1 Tax=Salix purpurea TaxID=77065 RepID=A0A9Q0Q525_SALPP|nr:FOLYLPOLYGLUTAMATE SYNTHASE [Salix purpurea]KAJ6700063.1 FOLYLPOLYGLUTAMATE SYNTHASE [Salix purpurea]